jgi:phosphate starvation-inducible PhoH-like protein
VRRRGNQFRLAGGAAGGAAQVLRDLFDLTEGGGAVDLPDVHLALREHELQDSEGGAVRAAPVIPLPGEDAARVPRGLIRARGEHQKRYLASIHGNDLTFGIGPAGTGKTYLAVACAVEALHSERVRRIVLVRPAVEAGERLGFLPGDLTQKVDPYLRPMYDALYEMMGFDRVARFIERNIIEVAPLAFMRGRSLNESFIILDEAQNTTPEQMKMFLTRIGFGSRAVVTGDITQTDLPAGKLSGLRHALEVLPRVTGVAFSHFDAGDVVRHPLVQRIVRAYEEQEPSP